MHRTFQRNEAGVLNPSGYLLTEPERYNGVSASVDYKRWRLNLSELVAHIYRLSLLEYLRPDLTRA